MLAPCTAQTYSYVPGRSKRVVVDCPCDSTCVTKPARTAPAPMRSGPGPFSAGVEAGAPLGTTTEGRTATGLVLGDGAAVGVALCAATVAVATIVGLGVGDGVAAAVGGAGVSGGAVGGV